MEGVKRDARHLEGVKRVELSGQQWETVVFKTRGVAPLAKPSAISALAPSNRVPGPTITKSGKTAVQLEEETEELKHQSVAPELKRAIMQARSAKRMTQKELAMQLGCDAKTVQEYESGRAIPNNALIAKMERAMGAKLPRAPRK